MVLRWLATAAKVFSASLWYARCHPSEIAFYLETITETITGNIWPLFCHFSIIISFKNIDALAEELCVAGMLINGNKLSTGVWEGDIDCSRVFNHDETTPVHQLWARWYSSRSYLHWERRVLQANVTRKLRKCLHLLIHLYSPVHQLWGRWYSSRSCLHWERRVLQANVTRKLRKCLRLLIHLFPRQVYMGMEISRKKVLYYALHYLYIIASIDCIEPIYDFFYLHYFNLNFYQRISSKVLELTD